MHATKVVGVLRPRGTQGYAVPRDRERESGQKLEAIEDQRLPGASTIEDYALAGIKGDLTPRARRSEIDRDSDLADDEFNYRKERPPIWAGSG